ncbi:MAG: HNH endonuclease [Micrococcales bacterium]|nr:HNH endonuclease [Micrococcales bacterium]
MARLEDEAARLAGVLNTAHAQLVDVARVALETESWGGEGIRSLDHWLTLRAGLSPTRARDVARLATRAAEMPAVISLLREGRLSLDQAAVIARHVPASHQSSAADVARHMTVSQLQRTLGRYHFTEPADDGTPAASGISSHSGEATGTVDPDETTSSADPDNAGREPTAADSNGAVPTATESDEPGGRDAREPGFPAFVAPGSAAARLQIWHDSHGRLVLHYSAPADEGALVEEALREAKEALFNAGRTTATLADALAEICVRSASSAEPVSRRSRYRVYIHVDAERGWVNGRTVLPQHIVDRLTCDGTAQPLWHRDGRPVSVGREMRIVPERTRRLILDRDRGCRFPGCLRSVRAHLEVHHIDHWADGGATDLDRQLVLCDGHHDDHHRGEFDVSGDPTRPWDPTALTFTDRHGRPIQVAEPLPPDALPSAAYYSGPSGETLDPDWFTLYEDSVHIDQMRRMRAAERRLRSPDGTGPTAGSRQPTDVLIDAQPAEGSTARGDADAKADADSDADVRS